MAQNNYFSLIKVYTWLGAEEGLTAWQRTKGIRGENKKVG